MSISRHRKLLSDQAGDGQVCRRRSTALILTTWLGTLMVAALVVMAADVLIRRDQEDASLRVRRDSANLVQIIAEQVARVIAGTDLLLQCLISDIGHLDQRPPALQANMTRALGGQEVLIQLSFADAAGTLVQTSVVPSPPPVSIADREHFLVHKQRPDVGLFISRPVFGRASGKWSIQLSRRISAADGSFAGVMVASLDPFYFSRNFDRLDVGRNGLVTVVGRDGFLRARNVMDPTIIGQDVSGGALFVAASRSPEGFLRFTSSIDHVTRLASFHAVGDYPLYVAAGFSEAEVMTETWTRQQAYRYGAAGLTALLVAVSALVTVQGRAQDRTNQALDQASRQLALSETQLQSAYADLELRVSERTAELRHSLASLREAQARASRSEKLASLGALAGGIAHEINTPIQFIGDNLSFIQSALDELQPALTALGERAAVEPAEAGFAEVAMLSEEMCQAAKESLEGIGRVRDIVQAVKMFSHPGAVTLFPQSPSRIVETAVTVSRNSWKHRAELTVEIQPDLPMVPCHGSDIDQVLLALILNAAEALEGNPRSRPGRITVAVRQLGREIEFSVADNGPGIPEDIRSKVWDLFFTTKEIGKGTGQGLAICHNIIVVKHGGTIDFESVVDAGTRFFFTLPLEQDAEAA
jgi:signal transduction histidine kinase